jgi:uncharacterized protein
VSVVADSSPLIHLSAISALGLVRNVFEDVLIPPSVFQEVVIQGKGRPGTAEVQRAIGDWMRVQSSHSLLPVLEELDLDIGECEAISLASEVRPDHLLMDDRGPVLFARSLGLSVVTTPLLLIAAKQGGVIERVKDHLDALLTTGFWLSDAAYREVLHICNEHPGR